MEVGWQLDFGVLTRTDIVRFAGAGGDFNPVHHDEPYATSHGYPSVFAMGMYTASLASRLIAEFVAGDEIRCFAVRFRSMVWPEERLIGRARFENARERAERRYAVIDVVNEAGEVKLSGEAVIGLCPVAAAAVSPSTAGALILNEDDLAKVLTARIGETVRKVTFPVEFGKVMEFHRAMKSSAIPANAALNSAIPVPLTFSVASALYAQGDASALPVALGLDLSRTVHGEQKWTYRRNFAIGDRIAAETRIDAVQQRPSRRGVMLCVTTRTDYKDEVGETIMSEDMVSIELPQT